jgi:hypothetical protein
VAGNIPNFSEIATEAPEISQLPQEWNAHLRSSLMPNGGFHQPQG